MSKQASTLLDISSVSSFLRPTNSAIYTSREVKPFWHPACALGVALGDHVMFRISIVETRSRRSLVLEGKLISPWNNEVESAWRRAGEQLEGRKLVIDLTNVTVISSEGEKTLLELMQEGAKFCCSGVLTRHVLRRLRRAAASRRADSAQVEPQRASMEKAAECRFEATSNVFDLEGGGEHVQLRANRKP
jgi:hypothetical protein